jgi:uncharacterized protein (TIGR00369 family)
MSATTESTARCARVAAGSAHRHEACLLCGDRNPRSLRLRFRAAKDDSVHARLRPDTQLQGYIGILHGGVVSAFLDAAMTHCLFHRNVEAVTADLHVRFVQPIRCRESLHLSARILTARSPYYLLRAELRQKGCVKAWAEGKFLTEGKRHEENAD